MVEYYGWINLNLEYQNRIENDIETQSLNNLLLTFKLEQRIFQYKWINGSFIISIAGNTNHFSQDVEDVIDFYKRIASTYKKAYGLLHIHNDEDIEHPNEFKILGLKKGSVQYFKDSILSPYNSQVDF